MRRSPRSRAMVHRRRRGGAVLLVLAAAGAGAWFVVQPLGGGPDDSQVASTASRSASSGVAPSTTPAIPRPPGPFPGYLLIADRGNDRMLLVDGHKHILWRYPAAGKRPSLPFHYDDDTFFTPGWKSIVSNQEDQQTIQHISFPAGKVVWSYGHVDATGSTPGYLHTPDDAYVLPDGTTSVADVGNCRILYISPARKVTRQIGTTGVCAHNPPKQFASPNGDTPLPNGGVLVTEITGSWIDAIDRHGKLMWSAHAPVAYPSDAQPLPGGRVILADYSSPGHVLIIDHTGKVLWSYGPASGNGALDHPSLALPLPGGLIAVNDDYNNRVVLIDRASKRIVWQYGHDGSPGTAPGYLNTPDGMDFLPYGVVAAHPAIARALKLQAH